MPTFPPTTSTIPANPKIKISMKGLGILCLNKNMQAEIGYLDISGHDAIIRITDPNGKTTTDTLRDKELVISSNAKPEDKKGCECFESNSDSRNFSNMIDLSEFYPGSDFKAGNQYQSKIFIEDSVFFTDPGNQLTVDKLNADTGVKLGQIENVGTNIWGFSNADDVKFTFDGKEFVPGTNETYLIQIDSHCPGGIGGVVVSDFKFYFDYLLNAGDVRFNLEKPKVGSHPLSEQDKQDLEDINSKFISFNQKNKITAPSFTDSEDLSKELLWSENILCSPEPCLKVTFVDKPRSL